MTSRFLPTLALAGVLALSACGSQSDPGAASGTSGTSGQSSTTGQPGSEFTTEGSSGKPDNGPRTPPPGDDRPAEGTERLYGYDPNGHAKNPWMTNGAKAGIITSATQIPGVVKSLPAAAQATASKELQAAAKKEAPSAAKPWYVFASDGCQVKLELQMVDGNPKPAVKEPEGGPAECFAPEWRAAVYRYDASRQKTAPPAFTPPKR